MTSTGLTLTRVHPFGFFLSWLFMQINVEGCSSPSTLKLVSIHLQKLRFGFLPLPLIPNVNARLAMLVNVSRCSRDMHEEPVWNILQSSLPAFICFKWFGFFCQPSCQAYISIAGSRCWTSLISSNNGKELVRVAISRVLRGKKSVYVVIFMRDPCPCKRTISCPQ